MLRYLELVRALKASNYWPLTERSTGIVARDLIGGNHSTWGTVPTPLGDARPVAGAFGAIDFAGGDGGPYGSCASALNLGRDVTLAFWCQLDTLGNSDCAFGQGTSLADYWILIHRADKGGWVWQLDPDVSLGAECHPSASLAQSVVGEGWSFVCAGRRDYAVDSRGFWWTEKNAKPATYAERQSFYTSPHNNTSPLQIGRLDIGTANRLDGRLAHVAFFPRSLSRAERDLLYRVGRFGGLAPHARRRSFR